LYPTPAKNLAREATGRDKASGCQSHTSTRPGGISVKPSNHAPISAAVRPITGTEGGVQDPV